MKVQTNMLTRGIWPHIIKGLKSRRSPKIIFKPIIIRLGFFIAIILLNVATSHLGYAYPLNIALDKLAEKIILEISKNAKQIVAVADFCDLNGKVTNAGLFVSEELLNRLGKSKRIDLVERRDLKKILEELELHISGVVDSRSAKEVGALLGAEVLCTGTFIELLGAFKINARLIDTETGKIFAVAEVLVDKGEEIGILKSEISTTDQIKKRSTPKYQQGNFLVNGGFQQGYSGWKRSIGDVTKGFSQTEIISLAHTNSGKALRIGHKGEGHIQFHQSILVPGPDLIFSASFQASSHEGMMIGFSGSGVVQIALQFFGETGEKVGETVLVNYVKNPFADTPLIGVPRRKDDTYKTHYIEFPKGKFHSEYQIDIRKEVENNLLGMDPDNVRQVAVILWCGASHPQAGSELWITDITLKAK